jgi:hypothetical protein
MHKDDPEWDFLTKTDSEPVYLTDAEWQKIQSRRNPRLTDALRQLLDDRIDSFKSLQYTQKDSRGRAISLDDKRKTLRDPASKLLAAIKQMDWDARSDLFEVSQVVAFPYEENPCVPVPCDVFELFERLETDLTSLLESIKVADKRSEKRKVKKKPGFNPEYFLSLVRDWDTLLLQHDAGKATENDVRVIAAVATRIAGQKFKEATIDRALKIIENVGRQSAQPRPQP